MRAVDAIMECLFVPAEQIARVSRSADSTTEPRQPQRLHRVPNTRPRPIVSHAVTVSTPRSRRQRYDQQPAGRDAGSPRWRSPIVSRRGLARGRSRIGVEEVQLLAAWEEARATRDGRGTLGIRTARAAKPAPMRVDWQQAPASFCLGCAVAESHRCRMQVRGSKGLCLTLDVVAPSVTKRLQGP